MKIHLKQIPPEGLHLRGEEDCVLGELDEPDIRCAGPLHYDITVGLSSGALWANGTLTQPVELRCVACLERFVHQIKVVSFVLHTELHGPELVDLTPFMREDVLLNMPAHPRCDRDGGRECKTAQSNQSGTQEKQQGAAKREHDWGELDKLKPRLKS